MKRGPTGSVAEGDPQMSADDALRLAAELSDRARREAETARRLAAVLTAQATSSTAPVAPERPERAGLTIGCHSCSLTLTPTLRQPDEGAHQAREFFDRHPDCLTFVDLEPIRRLLV